VVAPEESGGAAALTSTADGGDPSRKVPKSLVIRKGKTAAELGELVTDLRRLMLPFTAVHFQDDPKNRKLTLQQYCTHLALPMGITHILQFTQKEERCHLRLARLPEGPVLTFRVHQFSLSRHIVRLQKRPIAWSGNGSMKTHPPVVVTNNFGDHTAPPHVKLMRITFQNLFPQINVSTVKLKDCRRVVLFNLVEETVEDEKQPNGDGDGDTQKKTTTRQVVHVRHYAVKATPVGVNRRVRRLIHTNKALPNLHQCQDIADYLTGQSTAGTGGNTSDAAPSDSEPEDGDQQVVQLSDPYVGRGNVRHQKSALQLVELGPRLTLQLLKVEKGLDAQSSATLYHAHVTKTAEEVAAQQAAHDGARQSKQQRRAVQEANVERKRRALEERRAAKRQRQEQRQQQPQLLEGQQIEGVSSSSSSSSDDSSEDED